MKRYTESPATPFENLTLRELATILVDYHHSPARRFEARWNASLAEIKRAFAEAEGPSMAAVSTTHDELAWAFRRVLNKRTPREEAAAEAARCAAIRQNKDKIA